METTVYQETEQRIQLDIASMEGEIDRLRGECEPIHKALAEAESRLKKLKQMLGMIREIERPIVGEERVINSSLPEIESPYVLLGSNGHSPSVLISDQPPLVEIVYQILRDHPGPMTALQIDIEFRQRGYIESYKTPMIFHGCLHRCMRNKPDWFYQLDRSHWDLVERRGKTGSRGLGVDFQVKE